MSDVTLWLGGRGKEGGVRRDTMAGRERKGMLCVCYHVTIEAIPRIESAKQ